ncbi:MAG: glycosyltransferase [Anaerolineaceae bacterium]|nr:glycosyltransferase [Anaerolineaceae bacterium]
MRKGQNPVKQLNSVAKPQRITAAVLNHIPFLEGFYTDMLKVLDASLRTLRENAGIPFDLLVFDNGSCKEARDYLLKEFEQGRIQQLILSDKNVGKGGAWNVMLQAAAGEIIAYADNDVIYAPNWLKESVKVLETYPKVGMVTSRPFHTRPELYSADVKWAESNAEARLERGHFIEPQWIREFLLSVGRTEDEIQQDLSQEDVKITYKGVTAYAGASHWQFLAWKKTLQEFLPIDLSKPLGQVLRLDEMIDQNGYLRLMTAEPYTMNLSNSLETNTGGSEQTTRSRSLWKRVANLPIIRSPLMRIYNAIFKLYYEH